MIQGQKFIELADYIFRPYGGNNPFNHIVEGDYRYLKNTLDFEKLKDGDIIYTHTFYIPQLFERLNRGLKLTVISHNCDTPAESVPPEGVTWFTSNVNIEHDRVIALPLGLQNDIWFPEIRKKEKMIQKMNEPKNLKNLVYCDHRLWVNPEERIKPYKVLEGKPWATCIHTDKTDVKLTHETPESFDRYLENLYNHAFVICAEGNGIDTHRVWECLYMNTIPVMIRNINNSFYSDLPILFIDDWEELSQKFLHDSFMDIAGKKWNTKKLDFDYWKHELT